MLKNSFISRTYFNILVFDLWDGNMGMLNQSQNLYLYIFRILKNYETSTNVIGRLVSIEFFNHFSIFFLNSTNSFELNKFN